MFARNVSTKPIGFGKMILLPEEEGELPKGYDENHPTVAFYLSAKPPFLEKISLGAVGVASDVSGASAVSDVSDVSAVSSVSDVPKTVSAGEGNGYSEGGVASDIAVKINALEGMKLSALRQEAADIGLEYSDADTKAVLTQKLTGKYQSN